MIAIQREHHRRRGSIVHEATVAILLAVAVISGAAEVMAVVSKQQREMERRSVARREVGNLMEEVMLRPWNDLTEDADPRAELSAVAIDRLPNARATINVATSADDLDAKRISIELTWGGVEQPQVGSLRLVSWRYAPREDRP